MMGADLRFFVFRAFDVKLQDEGLTDRGMEFRIEGV